jgi:hypothetical protein
MSLLPGAQKIANFNTDPVHSFTDSSNLSIASPDKTAHSSHSLTPMSNAEDTLARRAGHGPQQSGQVPPAGASDAPPNAPTTSPDPPSASGPTNPGAHVAGNGSGATDSPAAPPPAPTPTTSDNNQTPPTRHAVNTDVGNSSPPTSTDAAPAAVSSDGSGAVSTDGDAQPGGHHDTQSPSVTAPAETPTPPVVADVKTPDVSNGNTSPTVQDTTSLATASSDSVPTPASGFDHGGVNRAAQRPPPASITTSSAASDPPSSTDGAPFATATSSSSDTGGSSNVGGVAHGVNLGAGISSITADATVGASTTGLPPGHGGNRAFRNPSAQGLNGVGNPSPSIDTPAAATNSPEVLSGDTILPTAAASTTGFPLGHGGNRAFRNPFGQGLNGGVGNLSPSVDTPGTATSSPEVLGGDTSLPTAVASTTGLPFGHGGNRAFRNPFGQGLNGAVGSSSPVDTPTAATSSTSSGIL